MADRVIEENGRRWRVALSGRRTQYNRDEFGVVFTAESGNERRISRFSPLATKIPELAFGRLTDRDLLSMLARSQQAATSPELGYGR
jgi:hypothetical protein